MLSLQWDAAPSGWVSAFFQSDLCQQGSGTFAPDLQQDWLSSQTWQRLCCVLWLTGHATASKVLSPEGTRLSHRPFQTCSPGNLHFTYGKVKSMGYKCVLGNNSPKESLRKEKI